MECGIEELKKQVEDAGGLHPHISRLFEVVEMQENTIKRYEKALCSLLNLSCEAGHDILIDIVIDALLGHELMEKHEEDSLEGFKILHQFMD